MAVGYIIVIYRARTEYGSVNQSKPNLPPVVTKT